MSGNGGERLGRSAWSGILAGATLTVGTFGQDPTTPSSPTAGIGLPTLKDALAAGRDLSGEAAMSRLEGAGYEFFVGLPAPLRYVNAAFRHYPIVLRS